MRQIQWKPSIKATKMVAFQKRWPAMRGKINMISKECMEMDYILQLYRDIPGLSTRGVPLYDASRLQPFIISGMKEF